MVRDDIAAIIEFIRAVVRFHGGADREKPGKKEEEEARK
jgi:hypothetical protein